MEGLHQLQSAAYIPVPGSCVIRTSITPVVPRCLPHVTIPRNHRVPGNLLNGIPNCEKPIVSARFSRDINIHWNPTPLQQRHIAS
ncbi:hypothetical protein AVEN_88725-1 [Araneus ventricosus]|nr:hypothetical protein AVEN_264665-1 [Araneus ventricosus]GBM75473.1 hypothetical protein AVEN_88725-1 [Araneus ventricosus]